jgi:ribonuclease Z
MSARSSIGVSREVEYRRVAGHRTRANFCPPVLSLGYVITEPALYEPFDIDAILPKIASQMPQLQDRSPSIRHPRQVLSIVNRTRQPFTLPDGSVIQHPPVSTVAPRKIAILGDCSGTDNPAFLRLVDSPSMLVHECTNAWVDPRIEKGLKAEEGRTSDLIAEDTRMAMEKIQSKAISRGHSDAQMAGRFAKTANARRLVVNHFSAM